MSGAATCPRENSGCDRRDVTEHGSARHPISRGARAEECVLLSIATALVNAMWAALLALVFRRDAERAEGSDGADGRWRIGDRWSIPYGRPKVSPRGI